MKILCIHGLRHNKILLERSMKSLIKKFKNDTFVFVNSKFKFENEDDLFCWWNASRDNALTIEKYDNINESIEYLLNIWNNDNFDGILGFSQGSVLAQIFCYYSQNNLINLKNKPKFAILCSTSIISDISLKYLYNDKINIPLCITYGINDQIINEEHTLQISKLLSNEPYIIVHDGGHYVSSSKNTIEKLKSFFDKIK